MTTHDSELARIPLVKLPPGRFADVMQAVASSNGTRRDTVRRILDVFPLGFDEKRAFRALAAPTLTRFHFARSRPPFFELAPNGIVWRELEGAFRSKFVGLVLCNLVRYHLGLHRDFTNPVRLKTIARQAGPRIEDRVSGFVRYLIAFPPPEARSDTSLSYLPMRSAGGMLSRSVAFDVAADAVGKALKREEIIKLDVLRVEILRRFLAKGWALSSFMVDRFLSEFIDRGDVLIPILGGRNSFDALIYSGRPYAAVRRGFEA